MDRDVEDIWRDHFDYFYREYGMCLPTSFHVNIH